MMRTKDRTDWEQRAQEDGAYAIALALADVASALRALGTGDAASTMGAIEFLATHIGEKIEGVGWAVTEVGSFLQEGDRQAVAPPRKRSSSRNEAYDKS